MGKNFTGSAIVEIKADLAELQETVENLELEGGTVDTTARDTAAAALSAAGAAQDTADDAAEAAAAAQADIDSLSGGVTGSRVGSVILNGGNPTPVNFGEDLPAVMVGGEAAPFDLSTDGLTIVVTVDGTQDTATFNCAAGTSVSGDTPSTDITGEVDTKFNIAIDGGDPEEVTLDKAGKDDGTKIATEMQTKIRALGGAAAAVTVAFGGGKYTITSATKGTGSSIVITPAASGSITEELKIGVAGGGVETAGTGDFVNAAAATIEEVLAVLAADLGDVDATDEAGAVKLTAGTATRGQNSVILVGAGTANTVLGFTQAATVKGAQGLEYECGMANASYLVFPQLSGVVVGSLPGMCLSINDKTVDGFNIVCETAAATSAVDLLIIGAAAEVV